MDWNRIEGSWKQVRGKIKEKWGQLTDDDLNRIDGKREQLERDPEKLADFSDKIMRQNKEKEKESAIEST